MLRSYQRQQREDDAFVPEEDTDSDDSDGSGWAADTAAQRAGEKGRLYGEFERLMRERFLNGDDSDFFDYSTVDTNELLDDDAITGIVSHLFYRTTPVFHVCIDFSCVPGCVLIFCCFYKRKSSLREN